MSRRFAGTFSYLRRHYFDDDKLKQLAKTEFVRAMRTGRLIAFTGSLSTAEHGYPRWGNLLRSALDTAATKLEDTDVPPDLIQALRETSRRDERFDSRVAFSAVAQMLDHKDPSGKETAQALDDVATPFRKTKAQGATADDVVAALFDGLHIDRVVTTNYDFELERQAMRLSSSARRGGTWDVSNSVARLGDWLYRAGSKEEGYSIVLNLPNGDRIVSDIMQRDRPETLIEFAIGCPENDRHIFHLHGRADQPGEIILSYRDYDRLYRRRGLGKLPFEHALRILFAGNPVIFVGLGMSEPELNKTLSEFVGDHPYLRKTPAFLIWNTPEEWGPETDRDGITHNGLSVSQRIAVFRLDMLHRLGILTLFTEDLKEHLTAPPDPTNYKELRQALLGLTEMTVAAQRDRLERIPWMRWRHALNRVTRAFPQKDAAAGGETKVINTWDVDWTDGKDADDSFIEPDPSKEPFIRVILRPAGASKSGLARAVARAWTRKDNRLGVILNFNMRIDTDSTLAYIADLLRYEPGRTDEENLTHHASRETEFAEDSWKGLKDGRELLLVLKGLERIFDVNGHPLSAEFDQFLRILMSRHEVLASRVKLVVIATERVAAYFEGLGKGNAAVTFDRLPPDKAARKGSAYLDVLKARYSFGALDEAKFKNRVHGDHSARRRTLYRAILTAAALAAKGVREPDLALEIVTVMAYIGQPIERAALFHAPSIQQRLGGPKVRVQTRRRKFNAAFDALIDTALLVKEINTRPTGDPEHRKRYAVHLSLQTEIRDRNGLPLSDAILSTAYNMSLFSAQPADSALPEAEVHDELGRLVDWMADAHKNDPLDEAAAKDDRGAPHAVAALRAAVSLVRGLYSTSALLSVDRGNRLIAEERDGLLAEHAARLERILGAFDETWRKRGNDRAFDAEPLYPDELVWLHNERGVVKLAQGDLYEARFSFNEADRVNRTYVERDDSSHNWRRISLNQLVVDIERGRLYSADERMNSIERQLGPAKANHIRSCYLDSSEVPRIRFDALVSHEDILAMALITGYRGLAAHLRGELDAARINFDRAIRVLQRMDEQRALALFRRHKASVHGDLKDNDMLRHEARLAMSGAESVRQLDIVYAGRLMVACVEDKGDPEERKVALRAALEALDYATLADMHRLSVEAQSRLGSAKFQSGDYDAALEHVSEAMATATRYGMTLYKISLRTQMGQILAQRGNKEAGRTLIQSAINGALRVGYQRAIASARQALAGTTG